MEFVRKKEGWLKSLERNRVINSTDPGIQFTGPILQGRHIRIRSSKAYEVREVDTLTILY